MSGDGFDTKLTGTIPTMPGNLTQIWLWNMKLDGRLPEQLFELSGLTSLRLCKFGTNATCVGFSFPRRSPSHFVATYMHVYTVHRRKSIHRCCSQQHHSAK